MCAFDVVANNADRKSGHVLLGDGGRLWGIDHGLCFHRQPKLRTVIWDFADEPVPPPPARRPRPAGRRTCPTSWAACSTTTSGRPSSTASTGWCHTGTFPEPLGDRPPYPWPLV